MQILFISPYRGSEDLTVDQFMKRNSVRRRQENRGTCSKSGIPGNGFRKPVNAQYIFSLVSMLTGIIFLSFIIISKTILACSVNLIR